MKRNFLFNFFIVAEVILSSGCGTQQEIPKTTAFYQVVDSAGRTVELEKKPKRVVLLATAFPEILLAVDGDFEAWANNPSIKEPAWARGKKTVGYVYDINIESVVAMNPDLVVGLVGLLINWKLSSRPITYLFCFCLFRVMKMWKMRYKYLQIVQDIMRKG